MNNPSAPNTTHPDNAQLDQLRAGLLDHRPEIKSRLLNHLRECAPCRHQAAAHTARLDELAASLRDQGGPRLTRALRARRMAALAGEPAPRPAASWLAPAFALAAVVAIAIGVGGFLELSPARAPASTLLAQAAGDTVPDLYADIDFYLWLSNHPSQEKADADRS